MLDKVKSFVVTNKVQIVKTVIVVVSALTGIAIGAGIANGVTAVEPEELLESGEEPMTKAEMVEVMTEKLDSVLSGRA